MDLLDRVQSCHDYIRALEEERKKIEVFQRELPLCLKLVTHAIESVRQQMSDGERVSNGPVLEEFIPLKPSFKSPSSGAVAAAIGSDRKPDWLRSVQLWNQEPDTSLKVEPPKKPIAVSAKRIGGAFQPFEREKLVVPPPASRAVAASSTNSAGGRGEGRGCGDSDGSSSGGEKEEKEKEGQFQSHRKTRRCWSPDLHRRFLNALQQLGGSHAATPKQIRDLMKVDGLTNDEIKSHLQKYRLHTRRPSPAVQSSSHPAPQFVLLVPPPDYAAAAAVAAAAQPGNGACAPTNGIYAPVASLPSDPRFQQQLQTKKQYQRSCSGGEDSTGGDDDDATNTESLATSASSQTTTASPPF
ncbi:transcription factor NIGT1-like [Musa acuminata AAA Group]|uniref:transcription factor NIGT1 n=1 Tax=Musa acuminata AAA Group TaxID=214697 RepID=UPI0031D44601